ncbi:glycine--tRNA ligase, mitochondrial 1-like protein [Tanacetum coccineum]
MNIRKDGFNTVHGKTGADVDIPLVLVDEPPRCDTCKIFDHINDQCPKKVKVVAPTQESDDGFVEVTHKHVKGKQNEQLPCCMDNSSPDSTTLQVLKVLLNAVTSAKFKALKAMKYLDKPAIHETMTKAIEGPPGVSGIEVLSESDALALAPVGEQENGVKVLPSPSLVLSIMSLIPPRTQVQCTLEVVQVRRDVAVLDFSYKFGTTLDIYEALILHGNDKNAADIDKRIGSAIAQLEATTQFRTIERSPPTEEVIQSGVVPRFVEFLMREDFHQVEEGGWDANFKSIYNLNLFKDNLGIDSKKISTQKNPCLSHTLSHYDQAIGEKLTRLSYYKKSYVDNSSPDSTTLEVLKVLLTAVTSAKFKALKAMKYLDKPAIHETMTKAIEGPPGVSRIEVLSESDALALAPVGEQENGVKVLPSPSLVLSIMSLIPPRAQVQCPLEVVQVRRDVAVLDFSYKFRTTLVRLDALFSDPIHMLIICYALPGVIFVVDALIKQLQEAGYIISDDDFVEFNFFRADHLLKDYYKDTLEKDLSISSEKAAKLKHILVILDDLSAEQLGAKIKEYGIVAPTPRIPCRIRIRSILCLLLQLVRLA